MKRKYFNIININNFYRYQLNNLSNACIEYCSYRVLKVKTMTEFKQLSKNLQNLIKSRKKEGNWIISSNSLENFSKKWNYFKYKIKN